MEPREDEDLVKFQGRVQVQVDSALMGLFIRLVTLAEDHEYSDIDVENYLREKYGEQIARQYRDFAADY